MTSSDILLNLIASIETDCKIGLLKCWDKLIRCLNDYGNHVKTSTYLAASPISKKC